MRVHRRLHASDAGVVGKVHLHLRLVDLTILDCINCFLVSMTLLCRVRCCHLAEKLRSQTSNYLRKGQFGCCDLGCHDFGWYSLDVANLDAAVLDDAFLDATILDIVVLDVVNAP